jgi:two-component system, OmpR family, phosphate regulon sensor histidine kinase PhoR
LSQAVSLKLLALSLALALTGGLLGIMFWQAELAPIINHAFLLNPQHLGEGLISPNFWLGSGMIIAVSVSTGLMVGRVGLRTAFPFFASTYLCLGIVSLMASRFLAIDILFVPSTIASLIAIVVVQIARLWSADRELTRVLIQSVADLVPQSSEAAQARLISGLKLLATELPLIEAIVFRQSDETFVPVARHRTTSSTGPLSGRNSAWREGIELCERALKTLEIVTHPENYGRSINVAVPLHRENRAVGALLLRLPDHFREEDRSLLTAVGAQMARNLQCEDFCKSGARSRTVDYFSFRAARKKLEALYVLNGLLTEQRCGENVLANLSEGVAIAHLDGTLVYVNPALERIAGISRSDVKNLNIFQLLERFRTDVFDEPAIAVRRVLQSGEPYEGELSFIARNEILGLRINLIRELRMASTFEQPLCLAVYVRDLTRIKEYEQLKSDMISLMSHELRTPLTSINGFAELLSAETGLPEQAKEFVTIIGNESQRLSRMINTFLAVTQLERKDKQEVLKIPLRLNEVVRETITSLQPAAKKKRIRLIEEPAQRLPPVAADKSLITQAVKNLVNNAIKYSPERTTVTISTALEAETVRVSVEDRGFGIPPESRDRVWEKFYRVVREGQEKDDESTGLGLSFVREVVEQHGGNVNVESEEGRGSKFSFTLPRL